MFCFCMYCFFTSLSKKVNKFYLYILFNHHRLVRGLYKQDVLKIIPKHLIDSYYSYNVEVSSDYWVCLNDYLFLNNTVNVYLNTFENQEDGKRLDESILVYDICFGEYWVRYSFWGGNLLRLIYFMLFPLVLFMFSCAACMYMVFNLLKIITFTV